MKIQELFERYKKTQNFTTKKEKTRKFYEYGTRDLALFIPNIKKIKRSDIILARDSLAGTPGAANRSVATASVLLSYALDIGIINANPCIGIRKLSIGSIAPFTQDQIDLATRKLDGPTRRVFLLCLYTGQRIGDVLRIRFSDINDGCIQVTQHKTGEQVVIPLSNKLKKELTVSGTTEFIVSMSHQPSSYSNIMRLWHAAMRKAGITDAAGKAPTPHGLRKNAAAMLAEAGCTDREIMSITGHKTNAMVSYYTSSVEKNKLAKSAIRKLNG